MRFFVSAHKGEEVETLTKKERFIKGVSAATLSVLGIVGLAGCGAVIDRNQAVEVTQHQYDDPDTWTSLVMVGKVLVPMVHHDSEHYLLEVAQCGYRDGQGADEQGCLYSAEEVTPQQYSEIQDGDTIYLNQVQAG